MTTNKLSADQLLRFAYFRSQGHPALHAYRAARRAIGLCRR